MCCDEAVVLVVVEPYFYVRCRVERGIMGSGNGGDGGVEDISYTYVGW